MATPAQVSAAATVGLNITELENMALGVIRSYGVQGCISDQVRSSYPHLAYSSMTARWANLERQGRIVRIGDTRLGVSGRSQLVMRAADLVSDPFRAYVEELIKNKKAKKDRRVSQDDYDNYIEV